MSGKRKRRKIPTIKHSGIPIREIAPECFQVDFRKNGQNVRKCFRVLGEAKTFADMLAMRLKNQGIESFNLTTAQREDALKALKRLPETPFATLDELTRETVAAVKVLAGRASILDAASFWTKEHADTTAVPIKQAIEEHLLDMKRNGCRQNSIDERSYKLNRFEDAFDGALRGVKSETILEWMDACGWTGGTRDGYRRGLRAFFGFAQEKGYIETIPKCLTKKILTDAKLPEIFTLEQVRKLFAVLEEHAPEAVAYLAVQFFGGLRPGEAMGLTWEQVNFTERLVRVTPETSKVRGARVVEAPSVGDALFTWLAHYRKPSGGLGIPDKGAARRVIQRIVPLCGFPWVQDVGRKTFASAHFALHGDAGKTAAILGHSGKLDIFYNHYRGLMSQAEAASYFAIHPAAAKNNVIHLEATA